MRVLVWCCCLLLVALEWSPEPAAAISKAKMCRQSCGAAIDACVATGGKRKRCKRQTLKRCRKEGVETCTVTTTTTAPSDGSSTTTVTLPEVTTTTLETINGCTTASAVNRTAPTADRTVEFADFSYLPRCIRIKVNQSVTFSGIFGSHPISGGQVVGGNPVPDLSSPIPFNETGELLEVVFPSAGIFPYYCNVHLGPPYEMEGAVFVDP